MLRFRNGLSGTTSRERLALLYVEHECIQHSIQKLYEDRLETSEAILCDARDLEPTSCKLQWARHKGLLFVLCEVYFKNWSCHTECYRKIDPAEGARRQLQRWANLDLRGSNTSIHSRGRREGWWYGRRDT
jgi:hypothetical protein